MFYIILTEAADSISLGRFDHHSLADQQHMELFIVDTDWNTQLRFQDESGDPLDICDWDGVKCNADGRVTQVSFWRVLCGTVHFAHIPPLCKTFYATENRMQGTLQVEGFPNTLKCFNVSRCRLSGRIDLAALPASLTLFSVATNGFSGSCELRYLPPNMLLLDLERNQFSGIVDLVSLPPTLQVLSLQHNAFTGGIRLDALPQNLRKLYIQFNAFSGGFELINTPPKLELCRAHANKLSGTAVVAADVRVDCVSLHHNGISRIVDLNGEGHSQEASMLADGFT